MKRSLFLARAPGSGVAALLLMMVPFAVGADEPAARILLAHRKRALIEVRTEADIRYVECKPCPSTNVHLGEAARILACGRCWDLGAPVPNTPAINRRAEALVKVELEASAEKFRDSARGLTQTKYINLGVSTLTAGAIFGSFRLLEGGPVTGQLLASALGGATLLVTLTLFSNYVSKYHLNQAELIERLKTDHPLAKRDAPTRIYLGEDHRTAFPVLGWMIEDALRSLLLYTQYRDAVHGALAKLAAEL